MKNWLRILKVVLFVFVVLVILFIREREYEDVEKN